MQIALLLFATAETLPTLRSMAEREDRPLLLLNPQWQPGQVVSDFGIGAGRRAAEEFVASFASVYDVKTMRMRGEEVRILRCYPGDWQVRTRTCISNLKGVVSTLASFPLVCCLHLW